MNPAPRETLPAPSITYVVYWMRHAWYIRRIDGDKKGQRITDDYAADLLCGSFPGDRRRIVCQK